MLEQLIAKLIVKLISCQTAYSVLDNLFKVNLRKIQNIIKRELKINKKEVLSNIFKESEQTDKTRIEFMKNNTNNQE